ncbi:MAG: hypothetical protein K0R03_2420 [Moraxellaceae bacterium]|jgi:hypothetical protein|nr:hypothetical protein [Moraxellaceae bacterium]
MKWLIALGVYIVGVTLTGLTSLFVVLLLAGPHSDLLPDSMEIAVIMLGWMFVLVVPALAARSALRRYGSNRKPKSERIRREPVTTFK